MAEERFDVSKFNPAQHKMNRINYLQQIINEAKMNLEAYNLEWNDYNINVWFKTVVILYQEINSKFTEEEKGKCEKKRMPIEKCMKKFPIIKKVNTKKKISIDSDILVIFKEHIEEYEDIVKSFQDRHGLDTPNMEDDEGL